jgi:RimJ/RimL family protein N-acetyltransferase
MSLVVVELAERHLADMHRWMDDEIARAALLYERVVSLDDHRAWFARGADRDRERIYIGELDGRPIGLVGFRHIDARHRSGELWIVLDTDHRGRHLAGPLLEAGLARGFGELGFNKVRLHVRTDNRRAIRLFERAGFQHEGVLREEQMFRGRPVDLHAMGLLAREHDGAAAQHLVEATP